MSSSVRDFNRRVNNLLADFSFVDSNTLSVLFDYYYMSLYGSQLFKFYDKNSLNCIYSRMEEDNKKNLEVLYNIFNSGNQLYTLMIKYSLTNCDSTLGENIRYLMHKYKFDMHQWYGSITSLFNKIDMYITSHTVIENRCTGMAIRDLCSIRDGFDHLPFTCNYKAVIESMCIN